MLPTYIILYEKISFWNRKMLCDMKVAENVRKNWEILFFAKKIERFAEQKTEEIFLDIFDGYPKYR